MSIACLVLGSCLAVPLWRTQRTWSRALKLLRGWRAGENDPQLEPQPRDRQVREMLQLVRGGVQRELESHVAAEQQRRAAELSDLAAQVAHAMRSPLAALDTLTDATAEPPLPEQSQAVVRIAAARMEAIAADLLDRCPAAAAPVASTVPAAATSTAQCLTPLLNNTLRTLRGEIPAGGPTVHAHLDDSAHGAFIDLPRAQLAALLRRLVAQAIEATPPGGSIDVHAEATAQAVTVSVCDSCDHHEDPDARGAKHGAAAAGPWAALKQLAQAARGELALLPAVPRGRRVVLQLPVQPQPSWHVGQLRLQPNQRVVIADDDPSMHAAWRVRLKVAPQISLHHVYTPDGLRTWFSQHGDARTVFLVDHDFRGHSVHGLDLIRELRLAARSVLVTSHGDDTELQARCAALALPLLNKNRLHSLPIHTEQGPQ